MDNETLFKNTRKLTKGKEFKNYKELCLFLNEKIKTGNAKNSQLKEFRLYFEHKKEGHKFIITEVFEIPIISTVNNQLAYTHLIEKLVIDMLLHDKKVKNHATISRSLLLQLLNMVNAEYSKSRFKQNRLSHNTKIETDVIDQFYNSTYRMLKNNLEKALDNLASQSLISWHYSIKLCKIDHDYDLLRYQQVDSFGDSQEKHRSKDTIRYIHVNPTKDEHEMVMSFERHVKDKLHCLNDHELVKTGKYKEYESMVKDMLLDYGIAYYYKVFDITFNKDNAKQRSKQLEFLLINNDRCSVMNTLNKDIIKQTLKNAEARQIKNKLDKKYLKDNKKLSDLLIKNKVKSKTKEDY